jgi:hypothetical protein
MITFRTTTDVTNDRRVVLTLPPETPTGRAELVVTVAPQENTVPPSGGLRRHFGAVHSGDSRSGDNDLIDDDLARAYGASHG